MKYLYSWCSGCGKRIEIGELCYEASDKMPMPNEYEDVCFCAKCFQMTDTGKKYPEYNREVK